MPAKRGGASDDFSSDEVAKPSKPHLDPTRTGASHFGLEEVDETGDLSFHAIVTDLFRIGRDPDSNLVIRGDTKASRRHATIRREGIKHILEDNGSSNGTVVNGEKIKGPHELKLGDEVQVGGRTFKYARRP